MNEECVMSSEDRDALNDVMQYALRLARRYYVHGEDIGEGVRGRVVDRIAMNYTRRSHITHRREVNKILKCSYADEIRSRFGGKHVRDKRALHGAIAQLNEDIHGDADDGGIDAVLTRVALQQEAARIRETRPTRAPRGSGRQADWTNVSPKMVARVLEAIAEADGAGTMTLRDIAKIAGTTAATVQRTVKMIEHGRF